MKKGYLFFILLVFVFTISCGDSVDEEVPKGDSNATLVNDEGQTKDEEPLKDESEVPDDSVKVDKETPESDEDSGSGEFNPDDPGYNIFFGIITMDMMNQPQYIAMGTILKAAREDYEEKDYFGDLLTDQCKLVASGTEPECKIDADCAPEQKCVPDKDKDGNPVEDTGSCKTERASLDEGPVEMSGFANGIHTFNFVAEDKNAYLSNYASGDGSLPAGIVAFDTEYYLEGAGKRADGPMNFSGKVYMPPALTITEPVAEEGFGGMLVYKIKAGAPLFLHDF